MLLNYLKLLVLIKKLNCVIFYMHLLGISGEQIYEGLGEV